MSLGERRLYGSWLVAVLLPLMGCASTVSRRFLASVWPF